MRFRCDACARLFPDLSFLRRVDSYRMPVFRFLVAFVRRMIDVHQADAAGASVLYQRGFKSRAFRIILASEAGEPIDCPVDMQSNVGSAVCRAFHLCIDVQRFRPVLFQYLGFLRLGTFVLLLLRLRLFLFGVSEDI